MKYLLISFAFMLLFTSCKVMYKPSMQNVPLIEEKGDFTSTLSYNNYQLAYGLTDQFGIMANGHYNINEWSSSFDSISSNEYTTSRWSADLGAGYYKAFGDNGIFELYGGGGFGMYDFDYDVFENEEFQSTYEYDASSWRVFVQPSFGFVSDNFEVAFSTRFVGVSFFDIAYRNYTEEDLIYEDLYDLGTTMYPFIEPAVTLRAGHESVKFHLQLIYSKILNERSLSYMPVNLNIGINLRISDLYKSRSEPVID
jgi:hypothetical protein